MPWRLEEAMQKVMGKQRRGVCSSSYQCHRQRRLLRLVALTLSRRSNNKWHRPHRIPLPLAAQTFPCLALYFSAPIIVEPRQAIGLFPLSLKMVQLHGQLNQSQYSQMTISLTNQIGCHQFMCKFLQIGRHCQTHHLLRDPRMRLLCTSECTRRFIGIEFCPSLHHQWGWPWNLGWTGGWP